MKCPDCQHECKNLVECNNYQKFNNIVLDAKAVAKIRKSIPMATKDFKGIKGWLIQDPPLYECCKFKKDMEWKYRFMTITFDPKKFSFKELSDIHSLTRYAMHALFSIKDYFDGNIILIREYHSSGVPHFHLNYSVPDQFCHNHVLLRMKYYFQQHLNNKHCIHDRIFNEGGKQYMQKSNTDYYKFWEHPDDIEIE